MVFAAVAALQPGGVVRAIVRDGLWAVAPARKNFIMLVESEVTFLPGGSKDRFFRKQCFLQ